jgi:NitT/TauT family transport system substrate-binding protein
MHDQRAEGWTRRRFLGGLTLTGTAGCLGLYPRQVAAEPPPETTTVRLSNIPAACLAPQFVAEELLMADGFTSVQYVKIIDTNKSVASGEVDFGANDAPGLVMGVDAGNSMVALASIHTGCYELFATDRIRSIRDLKGRTVAVPFLGNGRHAFVASMTASRRLGSSEGHHLGCSLPSGAYAPSRRREDRRLLGVCPRSAEAAGQEDRACAG